MIERLVWYGLHTYAASPTYIIGIDEIAEKGYIISANGEHPTSLPLSLYRVPN